MAAAPRQQADGDRSGRRHPDARALTSRQESDAAGGILALQRGAGNRAVAAVLQRSGEVSKAPAAETRVDDLFAAIEAANRERIFECAHADHRYATQVATDYQARHHLTIEEHLKAKVQPIDVVRALSFLRFGELRVADKLTIAVADTGFDMDALRRLLPQVRATSLAVVEQVMTQEHVSLGVLDPATPYVLPNGQSSFLAGILESKWFKKDATKVEYLALLAYGDYRQADKVMAALMGATIDMAAIRRLVEKAPDRPALLAEFNASWGKDTGFDLISRLAGSAGAGYAANIDSIKTLDNKDQFLAVFLLRGKGGLLDRMKIATKGWDDLSILWDYLQDLPPAQRKTVRESEASGPDYDRARGELGEADRTRLDSLLVDDPTAMQRLQAVGGDSRKTIMKAFKDANPADQKLYYDAYAKAAQGQSPGDAYYGFLLKNLEQSDFALLPAVIGTRDLAKKVMAAFQPDKDLDYLWKVLEKDATDEQRIAVLKQDEKDSNSTRGYLKQNLGSEFPKALKFLQPSTGPIQDRAGFALDLAGQDGVGSPAVADEAREVKWLKDDLAKLDAKGVSSAENEQQRALLEAKLGQSTTGVVQAVDAAIKAREEVEDITAQLVLLATAAVITSLTAGAGSLALAELVPMFEAAAVRAAAGAIASGVSRVAVNSAIKGDRFDASGSEGLAEFMAGTVDGMATVLGPALARGIVSEEYKAAMMNQTRKFAENAWSAQPALRRTVATALQGGGSGGLSSAVQSAANERTWRKGCSDGVLVTLEKAATGAAMGAATSAAMEIAVEGGKITSNAIRAAAPKIYVQGADLLARLEKLGLQPKAIEQINAAKRSWVDHQLQRLAYVGEFDATGADEVAVLERLKATGARSTGATEAVKAERAALKAFNDARAENGLRPAPGGSYTVPDDAKLFGPPALEPGALPPSGRLPLGPVSFDEGPSASDKDQLSSFVAGARQIGAGNTNSDARILALADHALSTFAPPDMPRPKILIVDSLADDTIGKFTGADWTLRVSRTAGDSLVQQAPLMAHEVRHGAQLYFVARYAVASHGLELTPGQVAALMHGEVTPEVIAAARARPLDRAAPEWKQAEWFYQMHYATGAEVPHHSEVVLKLRRLGKDPLTNAHVIIPEPDLRSAISALDEVRAENSSKALDWELEAESADPGPVKADAVQKQLAFARAAGQADRDIAALQNAISLHTAFEMDAYKLDDAIRRALELGGPLPGPVRTNSGR